MRHSPPLDQQELQQCGDQRRVVSSIRKIRFAHLRCSLQNMELSAGFVSNEHRELVRSASESADPLSVTPLQISMPPKSPRSPKSPNSKHASPRKSSPSKGSSPLKSHRSHSPKTGHPKKGGSGGKGTWGGLFDTDDCFTLDPNDPNYDSSEEHETLAASKRRSDFDEFRKKAIIIVEEYFANDDVILTANELGELGTPSYNSYFVKKLVSMAMDRDDKEKEMAAVLLSASYGDVIDPQQMYRGFSKVVESADDWIVDIPNAIDILALFIARAVVDDILPPSFLKKQVACLPKGSKGLEILTRAEKGYLEAPLRVEIIERRWGGSKSYSVEEVKTRINSLLIEYVVSGDKKEACKCIKDLKVPYFHHEIVKRSLIKAMEKPRAENVLLDLLKETSEEGLINTSQMTKGFGRMIDNIDDLSLDIPNARRMLQSFISKAASEGWLCASSLKLVSPSLDTKSFKSKAQSIIQEYLLTGDVLEVTNCLQSENSANSAELNAVFVKKLITLVMDRKNREKEMGSVLLTSLGFPSEDVLNGFIMLIESADDTSLDNPVVVEDLAMFLARAMVDEVLTPQNFQEIGRQFSGKSSIGGKIVQMTNSLLNARLSGERILRCWGGGGGSTRPGWDHDDVKEKIEKLLEEYESGGDVREACRCVKELGMPFFHHEVVKKAMVKVMEKKDDKLWSLLNQGFISGLISNYQMTKGFGRLADSLDDLALDVPDARKQFMYYVDKAKSFGWLDPSFSQ